MTGKVIQKKKKLKASRTRQKRIGENDGWKRQLAAALAVTHISRADVCLTMNPFTMAKKERKQQ